MKDADVILAPIPQADGSVKDRPAVVLREMPPFRDLLVCGVSTQLQQRVKGFDEIVNTGDADYASSGLKTTSLIRLGFLAIIPQTRVLGSIGSISKARHRRLLASLCDHLKP